MTHNFKHIIVKREDNQLVCLCYPTEKPVLRCGFCSDTGTVNDSGCEYCNPAMEWKSIRTFSEKLKAWEKSVVRIPCGDNKILEYLEHVYAIFLPKDKERLAEYWASGIELNPELLEIRQGWVYDINESVHQYINTKQCAYLSSPKEEKERGITIKLNDKIVASPDSISVEEVKEEESEAVEFAKWISKGNWKFNAKKKHEGYWIQFKGRGRGYTKETTDGLYQLFKNQI